MCSNVAKKKCESDREKSSQKHLTQEIFRKCADHKWGGGKCVDENCLKAHAAALLSVNVWICMTALYSGVLQGESKSNINFGKANVYFHKKLSSSPVHAKTQRMANGYGEVLGRDLAGKNGTKIHKYIKIPTMFYPRWRGEQYNLRLTYNPVSSLDSHLPHGCRKQRHVAPELPERHLHNLLAPFP